MRIAALFALGACASYGAPTTAFQRASIVIDQRDVEQVASELSVALVDDHLEVTATPKCADRARGSYIIVDEKRSQREADTGAGTFITLGIGGFVGGLLMALYTPDFDPAADPAAAQDEADTINLVGYLTIAGGLALFAGGIGTLIQPDVKIETLAPEKHALHALAPPSRWTSCGTRTRPDVTVELEMSGGGHTWRMKVRAVKGVAPLPADLYAWTRDCKTDVTIRVVGLDEVPLDRTSDDIARERSAVAEIGHRGSEHQTLAIEKLLPAELQGSVLEVGDHAGSALVRSYASPRLDFTYARTTPAPTTAKRTRASEIGAKCVAARQESCFAPLRDTALRTCRASCGNAAAVQKCELKREICMDETAAGIGGALAEACETAAKQCLRTEKQDEDSLRPCMKSCESSERDKACASAK